MQSEDRDEDKIEIIEIGLDDYEKTESTKDLLCEEETFDGDPNGTPSLSYDKSDKKEKAAGIPRKALSYVIVVISALLIALFVNRFVLVNAYVPSTSMEPTLEKGSRFIGLRMAYLFKEPVRGDIVVFRHKCYDDEGKMTLVKRIVGLPGEVIEIRDGALYVNGQLLREDYIKEPMKGSFGPYNVPEGSYFLMGDNRNVSDDARYWDDQYVPKDQIIAKAWFRYSFEIKNIN